MKDLNNYYTLLFNQAQRFDRNSQRMEFFLIVLLVAANFIDGKWLYILTIISLAIQVFAFILKRMQDQNEALAHKLQEYAMLYVTFKKDTFNFDVSQIKGKLENKIFTKALQNEPESSSYLVEETDKNALLLMIQENAFFNHHLFIQSSRRGLQYVLIPILGIIVFLILAISTDITKDQTLLIPRILIALLTTNIIFNQIVNILKWYRSAEEMLSLDNSIARQHDKGEDFWLHTFSTYNVVKSSTPLITERIYEKHKKRLNSAWKTRFYQIKDEQQ